MESYYLFLEAKAYSAKAYSEVCTVKFNDNTPCIYTPKCYSESGRLIDRDPNFCTLLAFTKILKITELLYFVFI